MDADIQSRRHFLQACLAAGSAALLSGCSALPGLGRSARKVPLIGILGAGSPMTGGETMVSAVMEWRRAMQDLGYVDGQTITYDSRSALGDFERLPALTAELVALRPDILLAIDPRAIRAAIDATTSIPILYPAMGDPVGAGWIASLARPGGNVTGLTYLSAQLSAKRLEFLKAVVPDMSRVLVLANPSNPPSGFDLRITQDAARTLRLQLTTLELHEPKDFYPAFEAALREGVDGIVALETGYPDDAAQLAASRGVPAVYHIPGPVKQGGLMYYGPNHLPLWRRGASYADSILRGARPADLPVEQASSYDLGINLGAARALGLTIPEWLLVQATEIIG